MRGANISVPGSKIKHTSTEKMDESQNTQPWEKLVDKEFQDVFFDTEGGEKEIPDQKQRERRLDKRREFGLDNKMSKW